LILSGRLPSPENGEGRGDGDELMACQYPIKVTVHGYKIPVQCGQCRNCRIRRKQMWVGRNLLEFADAGEVGRFMTLSYDDANVPDLLDYRHFSLFMKRYRYYASENGLPECRFFAVGEYGEKTGRPHWHVLIYGHAQQFPKLIPPEEIKAWKFGGAYDGYASLDSIGYCSGYVLKPSPAGKRSLLGMSNRPGIGFASLLRFGADLYRSHPTLSSFPNGFRFRGKWYPIFGYARDKMLTGYLNAGGLLPDKKSPMLIYMENALQEWGTSIEDRIRVSENRARAISNLKGLDNGVSSSSRWL